MAKCPHCNTDVMKRHTPMRWKNEGEQQLRCNCGRTRRSLGKILVQQSFFDEQQKVEKKTSA